MDALDEMQALVRLRSLISTGAARAARKAAGLSYAQVARPLQASPSSVYRWESGLRFPRRDHALRYLEIIDTLAGR